jgi:hypothetical protein
MKIRHDKSEPQIAVFGNVFPLGDGYRYLHCVSLLQWGDFIRGFKLAGSNHNRKVTALCHPGEKHQPRSLNDYQSQTAVWQFCSHPDFPPRREEDARSIGGAPEAPHRGRNIGGRVLPGGLNVCVGCPWRPGCSPRPAKDGPVPRDLRTGI